MKNKQLTLIFLFLLCINLISAITIYSGETITLELEKPYNYYSIVGNSTTVDINIIQNENFVIITPNKYSLNDSYEIIFFDVEKEIITIYQSSGGGGGHSTRYVDRNITNNITQYVDKEIIKDKEVIKEVPKEIIKRETPLWIWIVVGLLGATLIMFFIKSLMTSNQTNENNMFEDTSERRFYKDE